jgi:hypothetical protein
MFSNSRWKDAASFPLMNVSECVLLNNALCISIKQAQGSENDAFRKALPHRCVLKQSMGSHEDFPRWIKDVFCVGRISSYIWTQFRLTISNKGYLEKVIQLS